jgi:hypothetical protein
LPLWRVRVDLVAPDFDSARMRCATEALRSLLNDLGRREPASGDQGRGIADTPVVGLLFWVAADDVGAAASSAVKIAAKAGEECGLSGLYDVTVIPRDAVALPDDPRHPEMPD